MRLRLIVQIIIRLASLFCLAQFLVVLPQVVEELAVLISSGLSPMDGGVALYLASFIIYLALAGLAWFGSARLSRLIVGKEDATIDLSGLRLADLYCFAFVFLGLYFVLGNLAQLLNWVHLDFIYTANPPLMGVQHAPPSYYGLSQPLITTVAGLICLFKAVPWSRKLAARAQ